ncbi:MAG: glycosyltransferase family 4 protein [Alphaproteobacteria bacterium]|jgi:glycosyltransferase involved in cell wall biosynthesis
MRLSVLHVAYPLAPVGPDTAGGAEQVLLQLDRALTEHGHTSYVIACGGSRVAGRLIAADPLPTRLDDEAKRQSQRAHARAIRSALQRFPIDLVHMHGIDFHAYLPPVGVPTLVTLHLPLSWYPPNALSSTRANMWLHCVSWAQHRSAPPNTYLLPAIENGVDVDSFALRRKRNFALFLGRICPEKGVHLAIEAAERARMPLVIAGQVFGYDAHQKYFEEQVQAKLSRRCRFVGPVGPSAKRKLLAMARCVLIPSLAEETSSLVAREALAAGTPVIAFARGALAETIEHGRTGFLVSGTGDMAAAIPDARTLNPEHCRADARRRFPLSRTIDQYLALYRSLSRAAAPNRMLA